MTHLTLGQDGWCVMLTSWNGNDFCITGPLWRESTSGWWISFTKGQLFLLRCVIHSYISCLEHIDSSYSGPRCLWCHDDTMKWKWFLHYRPFVKGIHQWLVDFLHKGPVILIKMCNSLLYKLSRTHWLILFWAKMFVVSWWHHEMEMISPLLALCEGYPIATNGFPSQRANNVELWCFHWCSSEQTVGQTVEVPVIWDVMTLMWSHWNVTGGNRCVVFYWNVL